jgi:hypothetical protein
VDRIVEDVLERLLVLLFGLDHFRPEPAAEDMVLAGMSVVERARVLSVQVTHPLREVRERRLDQQVVVVAEEAAGVQAPAVAPAHPAQDPREDGAVGVVAEDRLVVVPLRDDVVVGACLEVAERSAHVDDRSRGARRRTATSAF